MNSSEISDFFIIIIFIFFVDGAGLDVAVSKIWYDISYIFTGQILYDSGINPRN